MTLINLNVIGLAVSIAMTSIALIVLAYEDAKYMGIAQTQETAAKGLIFFGYLVLFALWWQLAVVQLILGVIFFLILSRLFTKIYAPMDQEVFYLTIVSGFTFALPALLLLNIYNGLMAYIHRRNPSAKQFPALTFYAIAWFVCVGVYLLNTIF